MTRSCPVCGQEAENLQNHMGSHSKEEIVSALMRSHEDPSPSGTTDTTQSTSEPTSESNKPTTIAPKPSSSIVQSNVGLQGVLGFVDNSSLQLLTVNHADRQPGVNPIILQQACSLQSTSLIQSTSRTETDGGRPSAGEPSSQASTVTSSAGAVQIRRTLNNVNIVNNIGTNLQTAVRSVTSSAPVLAATAAGHSSVMLPSVNMGVLPFNMMGGMPSTPLLLPQVNGPTLLVNVPNYMAYQGIPNIGGVVMPGILGGLGSVASVTPMVVTSSPGVTTSCPASSTDVVTTSHASIPSCTPATESKPSEPASDQAAAVPSCSGTSLKTSKDTKMEDYEDETEDMESRKPQSATEALTISDPSDTPCDDQEMSSNVSALVSPPNMRQRHHSVITRPAMSQQISAIISPRSVSSAQADNILTSSQDNNHTPSSQSSHDNPQLPQLTLNFPSNLMMESSSASTSAPPSTRPSTSSVIVSHNSEGSKTSQSPASFSLSGQQPITVDTVEALQSALACDNDVQLVVSNDLLETPEFKALMQTMDQSNMDASMQSTPAVSPSPQGSVLDNEDSNSRPPLAVLDPPSPIPCSSKDVSRETTRHGFETSTDSLLDMTPASDDDMTLQDLIAVETIDESQMVEDDMPWSSQLSFESFNYILGNKMACEKCGLQFTNISEHKTHLKQCNANSGKSKGKKSQLSKKPSTSTMTSEDFEQKELISRLLKKEPQLGEFIEEDSPDELEAADIKPSYLTQEHSVATQNPLGSQNKHWKCGQCKVVYETGPQLLEHLDLIKRAKIKCIPCHIIFEDRKDLLNHRKKDHPADLLRLKYDPDGDVIEEPEPIDQKVYLPNALGEYVCDFCDRAFNEKDMLMKHLTCHYDEKPHECLECGKKFHKVNQLKEHKKRHFEEGNFQCNFCNKKFFSPNKLREHLRVHTGDAPLKCNICGKGFKRHSNLSEHKKIHDPNREVKPVKELFCHCGKIFKTQRDLDWHKEGEHDKEPKKCTFCLEVFVHSSSLTRHIRMKHEGNFMPEGKKTNNYARCPICSQVFYKTSINKHIRSVSNPTEAICYLESSKTLM